MMRTWNVQASNGTVKLRVTAGEVEAGLASIIAWNWLQAGYAVTVTAGNDWFQDRWSGADPLSGKRVRLEINGGSA